MPAIRLGLVVLLAVLPHGRAARVAAPAPHGVHALHATHATLQLERRRLACRVRLFRDDVRKTLQDRLGGAALPEPGTPAGDSLFAAYFNERFRLVADGVPLTGRVVRAGAEHDVAGEEMLWYELDVALPARVRRLRLRNAIFFERFRDEQNLVVVELPSGARRHTFLFTPGDPAEAEVMP